MAIIRVLIAVFLIANSPLIWAVSQCNSSVPSLTIIQGDAASFTIPDINKFTINPGGGFVLDFRQGGELKINGVTTKRYVNGLSSRANSPTVSIADLKPGTNKLILNWTDHWEKNDANQSSRVYSGQCKITVIVAKRTIPVFSDPVINGTLSDGKLAAGMDISIGFKVKDEGRDINKFTISGGLVGAEADQACSTDTYDKNHTLTCNLSLTSPPAGDYSYRASVQDNQNNKALSKRVKFTVLKRNTEPTVTIKGIVNSVEQTGSFIDVGQEDEVSVVVKASDADQESYNELNEAVFRVGSGNFTGFSGGDLCTSQSGCREYIGEISQTTLVEVKVRDAAGAEATSGLTFNYVTAPEVQISVSNDAPFYDQAFTVKAEVTDRHGFNAENSALMLCRVPSGSRLPRNQACAGSSKVADCNDAAGNNNVYSCEYKENTKPDQTLSPGGYTYYTYVKNLKGLQGSEASVNVNAQPYLSTRIEYVQPSNSSVLEGDPVTFSVTAFSQSTRSESIDYDDVQFLLDGSPVDNTDLKIENVRHCDVNKPQPKDKIRLCTDSDSSFDLVWTPEQAYQNITISAQLVDNVGNESRSDSTVLNIVSRESVSPSAPRINVQQAPDNIRTRVISLSNIYNTAELAVSAKIDNQSVTIEGTGYSSGEVWTGRVTTSIQNHGQNLVVTAQGKRSLDGRQLAGPAVTHDHTIQYTLPDKPQVSVALREDKSTPGQYVLTVEHSDTKELIFEEIAETATVLYRPASKEAVTGNGSFSDTISVDLARSHGKKLSVCVKGRNYHPEDGKQFQATFSEQQCANKIVQDPEKFTSGAPGKPDIAIQGDQKNWNRVNVTVTGGANTERLNVQATLDGEPVTISGSDYDQNTRKWTGYLDTHYDQKGMQLEVEAAGYKTVQTDDGNWHTELHGPTESDTYTITYPAPATPDKPTVELDEPVNKSGQYRLTVKRPAALKHAKALDIVATLGDVSINVSDRIPVTEQSVSDLSFDIATVEHDHSKKLEVCVKAVNYHSIDGAQRDPVFGEQNCKSERVDYGEPDDPGEPVITLTQAEVGVYSIDVGNLSKAHALNIKATMDGEVLVEGSEIKFQGVSYNHSVATKYQHHGATLTACVYLVRYREILKNGRIEYDEHARKEGKAVCHSTVVSHQLPIPGVPRFTYFPQDGKAAGDFLLGWQNSEDAARAYFKVTSWKGSVADKFKDDNQLTVVKFKEQLQHRINKPYLGQFSYELSACNIQDLCSDGHQITVSNVVPLLEQATLQVHSEKSATLTLNGRYFDPQSSELFMRLRSTGETYSFNNASLTVTENKVETEISSQHIIDGYHDSGLYLAVNNGVYQNGEQVITDTVLDGSGLEITSDLMGRSVTVSNNGFLYAGTEMGLSAFKIENKGLSHQWTHLTDPQLANEINTIKGVAATPVVVSSQGFDDLYFGALNHTFYKVRHQINAGYFADRHLEKWRFMTRGAILAPAQLDTDNNVYIGSMDEALYSLDTDTGLANWHYAFPYSGGIDVAPQLSASGHIYVTTVDGNMHEIDRSMIKANAIKWQSLDELAEAFADELAEWESLYWHPGQSDTNAIVVAKAYYILMQRPPTKAQLSFLTYLLTKGYPLNEIIFTLISGNPELANTDNAGFVNRLFEYLTGNELALDSSLSLGGKTQAQWVQALNSGVTRAQLVYLLLNTANAEYSQVVYSSLYYFYGYCLASKGCTYYPDSDGDGLNDQVELLTGRNPLDPTDGLGTPTLKLTQNISGNLVFEAESSGDIDEYQFELSVNNQSFNLTRYFEAEDNHPSRSSLPGDQSELYYALANGEYRFRVKACIRISLPNSAQDRHCSLNYSNVEFLHLTNSGVDAPISLVMPYHQAGKSAPSNEVLTASARFAATLGSFRVSESGAANYSLPLMVPEGIAGVTPQVSLNYSSQSGDSNVALGWSLEAGSAISRCRQTKAQDGQFKGLTLDTDDRLCLDGQRLISTGKQHYDSGFAVLDSYITEIDSQIRVVKVSTNSGIKFIVQGKDGSVKQYGGSPDLEIRLKDSDDKEQTLSWLLHKVYDNLENEETAIEYHYKRIADNDHHETVLSKITYSDNRIEFGYQSGPVRASAYVDTAITSQLARLSNIRMLNHHGYELSEYQFTFSTLADGRRTLDEVAQCRGTICKRPVKFRYNDAATALTFDSATTLLSAGQASTIAAFSLADLQGDGKPEMVVLYRTATHRYVLCAYEGTHQTDCRDVNREDHDESVAIAIYDHDNDGRQSVLINIKSRKDGINRPYWQQFGIENHSWEQQTLPFEKPNWFMRELKLADMNGDGYVDAVFKNEQDAADQYIYASVFNTQTKRFDKPEILDADITSVNADFTEKGSDWVLLDMNFDGLADIVSFKCRQFTHCDENKVNRLYVHYNQGMSALNHLSWFNTFTASQVTTGTELKHLTPADINGDGLVDLIYMDTSASDEEVKRWKVLINQSSERVEFEAVFVQEARSDTGGAGLATDKFAPIVADVDKNGRVELYFKSNNGALWFAYEWSPELQTFVKSDHHFSTPDISPEQGDYAFYADHNGDGVAEILYKSKKHLKMRFNQTQNPYEGMLAEITQGAGNKTNITYGLMNEPAVYSELDEVLDEDARLFQQQGLLVTKAISAMPLVQRVTSDSPASDNSLLRSSVDYHYRGARVQFGGRGWLGFKQLETSTDKADSTGTSYTFTTTTQYHQAFPLTGMPSSTRKQWQGNEVISAAQNTYEVRSFAPLASGASAHQVYQSLSRECSSRIDSNMFISGYACNATSITQDEYANVTQTITTQYDSDIDFEQFVTSGGNATLLSSVTTVNTYESSDTGLRLGRLILSEVTHEQPEMTALTRRSEFEYYDESSDHAWMLKKAITAKGQGCHLELTKTYSYDEVGNTTKVSTENSGCIEDKQVRYLETVYDDEKRYPKHTKQNYYKSGEYDPLKQLEITGDEVTKRNAFGQPLVVESPGGSRTEFMYDTFGSQIGSYQNTGAQSYRYATACDLPGCDIQLEKYVNGELVQRDRVDRVGRTFETQTRTVLGNWLSTRYSFDKYGRAVTVNAPDQQAVTTQYDVFDRVTRVQDPNADITTVNEQFGLTSTVTLTGNVPENSQFSSTTYNESGQVISVVDANGNTLSYGYDVLNQRVWTRSSADGNSKVAEVSYDQLGRKTQQKTVDLGTWSYTYNAFGELLSQTDARQVKTHFEYDSLGRKTRQWQTVPDSAYRGSTSVFLQTDIINEGASEWLYGGSAETYFQLKTATQGNDWKQHYYYDHFGRLVSTLTGLSGTTRCDEHVTFNTRANDLRLRTEPNNPLINPITSLCVIQQTAFDEYGRVSIQLDDYRRSGAGRYYEARGIRNHYQYGQLKSRQEAREGTHGEVYYNLTGLTARGQVSSYEKGHIAVKLGYASNGMIASISTQGNYSYVQNEHYEFDGLGNLTKRTLTNRDTERFGYDKLNRITHINGSPHFSYSASGNLSTKLDGNKEWTHHYGGIGIAKHALTTREYQKTVSQDGIGGPIDNPFGGGAQVYSSSNFSVFGGSANTSVHTATETSAFAGGFTQPRKVTVYERFKYDANGNQTQMQTAEGLIVDTRDYRTLKYTTRNKVSEVTGNSETVQFAYDAHNRRYKRTDKHQTVYYVGALELSVDNSTDEHYVKRYIGNDAMQIYYSSGTSKLQWLFTDHQGSIVAVTNAYYKLLKRFSYDVFGKQSTSAFTFQERNSGHVALHLTLSVFNSVPPNLRGYTGHEPVSLGGDNRIIHMNGRIYDAETGRFMQADPVVQAPSNLQNYNAYSYVLNNPLSYTDPSGYLFSALKKVNKKLKPFTSLIVGVGLIYITGGTASWFASSWYGAATAGAISGAAGAAANGGNILKGALTGAASAAAFYGVGTAFGKVEFGSMLHAGKIAAHGLVGGVMAELQGGNFGHGFVAAGVTQAFAPGIDTIDAGSSFSIARVVVSAIVGGTASKLSGGKFANGAVTGGFSRMFNDEMKHQQKSSRKSKIQSKTSNREEGKIYITGHRVAKTAIHLAIEYTGENGAEWISAGPEGLTIEGAQLLVSGQTAQRPTDMPSENFTVGEVIAPEGMTNAEYFNQLKSAQLIYCNCVDYDLFPGIMNSYNSNSFVSGIIQATGGTPTVDLSFYYGGGKPLPGKYFGKKE
ncbi:SpvB/TcaC N-terminal domain-containing protein [Pseudoalteromonas rubra]|uniref:Uncharacterized protein n=1 Tax=Pseudoalteromonas rubra TaxID=43658 RepID=A0A0U2Z8A1_9GAMM|nr:SpvB/TcaC N-terminal domain-containing protein [Pseudoalteromonas rubra]ALU44081.1 hypothetical protein AT705_14685 [Pseudoalteromonas rubra]